MLVPIRRMSCATSRGMKGGSISGLRRYRLRQRSSSPAEGSADTKNSSPSSYGHADTRGRGRTGRDADELEQNEIQAGEIA